MTTQGHEKYSGRNTRCPIKVFLEMRRSPWKALPEPFRKHKQPKSIHIKLCRQIFTNIESIRFTIERIHREILEGDNKQRTLAQKVYNARTSVLSINISIGDYVMVRTHAKRNRKLQATWRGPMMDISSESNLVVCGLRH